jgi:hypothetical protein
MLGAAVYVGGGLLHRPVDPREGGCPGPRDAADGLPSR